MKRRLTEESIIFLSILKWFILATIIGAIVGLSTTGFLKLLNISIEKASKYPFYFLLLPLVLPLSAIIIKYLAPDAEGHGTEKVIEAVHKNQGYINPMVVPIKLIATILTIFSGGSVGKEGPSAQIGAGLASIFARIMKLDPNDQKKLVICGISAGFASVFGTPIAGAIFGVEVLFVGSILYDVLLPSFISGITAFQVSTAFGIEYFHHPIKLVPVFNESFFVKIVLSGIFFGICSFFLIEILKFTKKISEKIKINIITNGVLAGIFLVVLTFLFSTKYLGLGLETIQNTLGGVKTNWYDAPMKIIFTAVTLNFGGSGGIVTPIFFIGATAGSLFADIFNLDYATFSAIGLVSLLGGAANTPIAASIMAAELFGVNIAPYATVACVISFLMTGHRSVYPSQVLAFKKTTSVNVELGKEVEEVKALSQPRKRSLTGTIIVIIRIIRKELSKFKNKT